MRRRANIPLRDYFETHPPDPLPLSREGGVQVREGQSPSLESLPPFKGEWKGGNAKKTRYLYYLKRIKKKSQREAKPLNIL
jgi:hypothetical protein